MHTPEEFQDRAGILCRWVLGALCAYGLRRRCSSCSWRVMETEQTGTPYELEASTASVDGHDAYCLIHVERLMMFD